nr:hypothetical protein [Tanacetum cinerariifolium]
AGQHQRQRAPPGARAEGIDALNGLARGVKVHDVRAVLVAHPKGAVGGQHQAFRVEAVGVGRQGLAVQVEGGFAGAALAAGVGQAGEELARGILEQDGLLQRQLVV